MTKKDYIKFAQMIIDLRSASATHDKQGNVLVRVDDVARAMSYIFKDDNMAHDRERFLTVAGVK